MVHCRASEDEDKSGNRISSTLSGLDALLGIDPEVEAQKKRDEDAEEKRKSDKKKALNSASSSTSSIDVSVSDDVLKKLRQADSERDQNNKNTRKEDKLPTDQIAKLVELGKRLQKKEENDASGSSDPTADAQLKKELAELMDLGTKTLPKEDVAKMKQEVFTTSNFNVSTAEQMTELDMVKGSRPTAELLTGGLFVRGTLRMPREEVFDAVYSNLQKSFGEKYELFLIPDVADPEPDPRGGPRVAWQVLPSEACRPRIANKWQWTFAVVLAVLTAASCVQLGLASNFALLPNETVAWLSNPTDLPDGVAPPGLDGWDPSVFLQSAIPIAFAVSSINGLHELGHRIAASIRKVKLGPSFFIPNGQLGSFGAVTPFQSMVRTRRDLFDVAAAGPIAAGIASAALFATGLVLSSGDQANLVPVPAALLQGSLALGSLLQGVVGEVRPGGSIPVHPMVIAGWAGLVSTAFNLLPVGCTDGGRMCQGAFGRGALSVTSFFMYVGLGLSLLGGGLALPFGIYVLIVQRQPEGTLQDSVNPPNSTRQVISAALIFAAILVLLPMAPDVADSIGGSQNSLYL